MSFKLSEAYIRALDAQMTNHEKGTYSAAAVQAVKSEAAKLTSQSYDGSQQTERVDLANLTEDQRKEINLFAVNIINQIRQQVRDLGVKGAKEVTSTVSMYNFAQDVANGIVLNPTKDASDNPDGQARKGDYSEAYTYNLINEMAAKNGLATKLDREKS